MNQTDIKLAPISSPVSALVISPLMLSDQMLTLAEACDGAGLRVCADTLVSLACAVFDEAAIH